MALLVGKQFSAAPSTDFISASQAAAWRYTAVSTGSGAILKMRPDVPANGTPPLRNPNLTAVQMGVYADNGANYPGALIHKAAVAHPLGSSELFWITLPNISVVSGTRYFLAAWVTGEQLDWQADNPGTAYVEHADTALPAATWPAGDVNGTHELNIWVEDAAGLPPVQQVGDIAPRTIHLPARMKARH